MSRPYIPVAVRQRVRAFYKFRCAYCQTQTAVVGDDLEVEHIIPLSAAGSSDETNLCLACSRCNGCKGIRTTAIDPQSAESVSLFHPRRDSWTEHFKWSEDGVTIFGQTPTGRATVAALKMNAYIIKVARQKWVEAGWHPPVDEEA